MMKKWMVLIALMGLIATPAYADEPTEGEQGDESAEGEIAEEEAEQEDAPFPIKGSVSTSGTFGASSVLSESEYTQTDYFVWDTSVGFRYSPIDKFTLSTGLGYSKYLSEDGIVKQREGRLSDLSLGLSWAGWKEAVSGIRFNASGSLAFPTSDASQFQGRILGSTLTIGANRGFGGLSLTYQFRFNKNFHEYTSKVGDPDELDLIARDGGAENVGSGVALGGVLPSFGISNRLILGFGFLERFNASMLLAYNDTWSYDNGTITANDEFTAENAVAGRGHSQSVVGVLGLGVSILDNLSADLSFVTAGQPLTNDNKSVRFPFWDFENGQSSRTTVSLGLGASF